jgi:hypothetical protein
MAGEVGEGDLPPSGGRHGGRRRQVPGQRVVQADDPSLGEVGQQQPGEDLGNGADLEDRPAVGPVVGAGTAAPVPADPFLATGHVPDHEPDPPPGPHRPLGQVVDEVHVLLSTGQHGDMDAHHAGAGAVASCAWSSWSR